MVKREGRMQSLHENTLKGPTIKPNEGIEPAVDNRQAVGIGTGSCSIHQAPGEAEAEPALLNRRGGIDDALVFGVRRVLKRCAFASSRGAITPAMFVASKALVLQAISGVLRLGWCSTLLLLGDYGTSIGECGEVPPSRALESQMSSTESLARRITSKNGRCTQGLEEYDGGMYPLSRLCAQEESENIFCETCPSSRSSALTKNYVNPEPRFSFRNTCQPGSGDPFSNLRAIVKFCRPSAHGAGVTKRSAPPHTSFLFTRVLRRRAERWEGQSQPSIFVRDADVRKMPVDDDLFPQLPVSPSDVDAWVSVSTWARKIRPRNDKEIPNARMARGR
ncbi:hypothetical protein NMY22_g18767 [Coprinellus aureogranulatus]|nr:hypothetical protein NMY22_g18767 [Coprinellus aureogranulatus]